MNKTDSIANLAKSLALAQKEIKPASFDAVNPHFRNKYATLASIYEACRVPLAKNGLSVIQGVIDLEGAPYLETMLVHESGEYITSGTRLIVDKESMQGFGSAITYARRYALAAMVGVVAEEDDDGNEASKNAPAPQYQRHSAVQKVAVKPKEPEHKHEIPNQDLLTKLSEMIGPSGVTIAELRDFTVKKYGKAKSTDLTREQLTEVIDHLGQVAQASTGDFSKFQG